MPHYGNRIFISAWLDLAMSYLDRQPSGLLKIRLSLNHDIPGGLSQPVVCSDSTPTFISLLLLNFASMAPCGPSLMALLPVSRPSGWSQLGECATPLMMVMTFT